MTDTKKAKAEPELCDILVRGMTRETADTLAEMAKKRRLNGRQAQILEILDDAVRAWRAGGKK